MYGYNTISQMMRNPNLRASDADREATLESGETAPPGWWCSGRVGLSLA